jgi:hypothetical protein
MSKLFRVLPIVIVAALASACSQGANEKAGEAADKVDDAATGTIEMGDGPKEELGEDLDMMKKDAANEDADLKDIQADQIRDKAKAEANTMENQADTVRKNADKKADVIENEADKERK